MQRYERPGQMSTVLDRLAGGGWTVLAGGTDLYPAAVERPLVAQSLLDITALDELRGVQRTSIDDVPWWRIGALTTWAELADGKLPQALDAIAQASREIGGRQVQHQATIGGNLCNASPAADGIAALLALDAQVELRSVRETRRLPLSGFVLGNRRTACRPDELLAAVWLPARGDESRSRFLKLGHRRYLVISIAMASVAFDVDRQGRLCGVGVAVGACSAVAQRLPRIEQALTGRRAGEALGSLAQVIDTAAFEPLSPIDDVRGTADYRRRAALRLVERALRELLAETAGGPG